MKDNNYSAPQVNKNGKKKFLASVMAFIIALTGGIGAKNAVKSYKGKNPEPTSQSDTVKTDPQEDLEYVLVKPFDINDEKSVKETINAVNENNKKDDSVSEELSEKMLKFYNGTLTKDDFSGMSDDDIANEVKNFTIKLNEVTSASILDYVNLREGEELTDSEESTKAIVLNTTFTKDSYAYETYATEYDTILNEQKKDIENGDKEDYAENTDKFITIMNTALKDDNLTNAQKAAIATITKTQSVLFWNAMTKDEQDYFLKEDQGKYNTSAVDEWFKANDIETSIDFDKTNGGDKSKNEYVDSDKKDAEKHAGVASDNKKEKVETGGQKISGGNGQQEIISNPTTSSSSSSSTADVPKEDLTKKPDYVPGGDVVSTTEKTETTTIIEEEVVAPEEEAKESNDYIYSDADFNSLDSKEKGLITLGSIVAPLGSMLVLKKKKRRALEEAEDTNKNQKQR